MTVIVMLILAGVSLNAIIGDNGIITNAQIATLKNSIAVLEEFLQEQYVTCYENKSATKIDTLIGNNRNYFYIPEETGLSFILLNNKMYYLIDKTKLPKEIQDGIRGGDAGDKTYSDYVNFNDVYGVTSDLKVYYCSEGKNSWFGAADEELKDSASRIALYSHSSSGLVDYLSTLDWTEKDSNGNVLADKIGLQTSLEINAAEINSLDELYNFSSLEKLYIKNSKLENLNGINTAPKLNYIYIENSEIGDYTSLASVTNLADLYLALANNDEVSKMCSGLNNSKLELLENLAIYGIKIEGTDTYKYSEVSDLTYLNNISSYTKSKIKRLYLQFNKITSFELTGFDSLFNLTINNNTQLQEISNINLNALTHLNLNSCSALTSVNINTPSLLVLTFENDILLETISGLSTNSTINSLTLTGCKKLNWLGDFRNS